MRYPADLLLSLLGCEVIRVLRVHQDLPALQGYRELPVQVLRGRPVLQARLVPQIPQVI